MVPHIISGHTMAVRYIEKFGNTAGTSIPLVLWEFKDRFKKGDILILSAFGAGFTWGSMYYKWAYDGSQV